MLSETPLVSLACKKTGISRSTFYRWYKDDIKFRELVLETLDSGRKNITDLAESMLIKEIQRGNMNSIRFWLQHNEPRYKPVRTTYVEPIAHYHELKSGERCNICGALNRTDHESVEVEKLSRKRLIKKALQKMAMSKDEKIMKEKYEWLLAPKTQTDPLDPDNKNLS